MKLRLACGLLCCATYLAYGQDPQPPQTPPQTPPPQQPQQPPPTAPGTPASVKPTVTMPPQPQGQPSKAPPPERDTEGDGFSIMPLYWMAPGQPFVRKGHNSFVTQSGNLDMDGNKKYGLGGVLTIPTGHENSLQLTYVRKLGMSNTTLGTDYSLFGDPFYSGDAVAMHYTMQYLKLSWNFLTYPFPSAGSKFRLKTLWEIQYVGMHGVFDAPGDTATTTTEGRKNVILPALGLGIEYHASKHVVFEAKGSGFGIPHHADLWDTEANLIFKTTRVELLVGGKAFHFKTSPNVSDNYFYQTLIGPYAGIRYIFK
ncbi:MAG: hypothetical protein LAO79_02420 [Acidobacteriia bacterium]|nr:hypothetical protein [Terriglobia bacterium]